MNKRPLYGLWAGFLLLCLFAVGFHRHTARASPFSAYPHNDSFDFALREHLHPTPKALLRGTWFLRGEPSIAMECMVDTDGTGCTVRSVIDWAMQCYNPMQLDARKLKSLQTTLRSLPPSSGTPPWDRLLILSYRSDGVWETRLYDKSSLPLSVQKVYQIVGASVSNGSGAAGGT